MLAVRVIGEIAEALEQLHRVGLVHGNISPGAIQLPRTSLERPVLVLLHLGSGTPSPDAVSPYQAPEIRSGGPPSQAGDHYALSLVLLEAVTGRRELGSHLPPPSDGPSRLPCTPIRSNEPVAR